MDPQLSLRLILVLVPPLVAMLAGRRNQDRAKQGMVRRSCSPDTAQFCSSRIGGFDDHHGYNQGSQRVCVLPRPTGVNMHWHWSKPQTKESRLREMSHVGGTLEERTDHIVSLYLIYDSSDAAAIRWQQAFQWLLREPRASCVP